MANVPCWRLGAAVGARTGAREAIVAYMSSRSDVERTEGLVSARMGEVGCGRRRRRRGEANAWVIQSETRRWETPRALRCDDGPRDGRGVS